MQAIFFKQIQNLKPDFRGFDFLLFLRIKSESNLYWDSKSQAKIYYRFVSKFKRNGYL